MAEIQLHWLGPPAIILNDRPLNLEMRKTLALLAYLSLSPQYPTRDTLAGLFWPEFDQQHALANLRRNLSSLAKQLPRGLLEANRETIGIRREDWLAIDVDAFQKSISISREHSHPYGSACPECIAQLEKSVAIYQGDFLQGFNLRDCPEFDRWQSFHQERLRADVAEAFQQLADYYQHQGECEKAIQHVQSWLYLDSLNETAQRMLIQLYRQTGQTGLALRQYENWVELRQSELGQAPDSDLLAVYQSLLPAQQMGGVEATSAFSRSIIGESEALVKTKLFIPPLRMDRVSRQRLFNLLDAGSQRSLTLVSAPAGFGKTTLLASWTAHTQLPIAWFSVDESDNDPVRFVTYLVAALNSVLHSNFHDQIEGFAQSLQTSIQPTLIKLLNHLSEEREPFVLILDDFQFIRSPEIHQALAFLLERMPACMHLVVATRSDPTLPLSLLRARDQLVEIRLSDLRFNLEESTGFLRQVMALDLLEEDCAALETRTEGWIAGLQMAALAIRTVAGQSLKAAEKVRCGQAVSEFIQAFSGSHRYILDFLGEEVLNRHPEDVKAFLLQTSILDRFCGPLCDAVTGGEGSQAIIQTLERENLFLVPLDGERQWYRYHHLFSDLLRFHLEEAISMKSGGLPGLDTLHRRAAEWLEKEQLFPEAIQHWIAARQYDRAAALIEKQIYPTLLTTGQVYTLGEWVSALPKDLYLSRPRLYIAKSWILTMHSQFAAASEQLELAWQAVEGCQGNEPEYIRGEIALVRGGLAELSTRDFVTMRAQGLVASEKLPQDDAMLRGLASWLIGASYLFEGDVQPAEGYLSQAIRLCKAAGNFYFTAVAILDLSNVRIEQCRHREAYRLLQQALAEMASERDRQHPSLGYLYNASAQLLLAWNELDEAEQQLKTGIDLVAQDLPDEVLIMGLVIMPYLKLAQGKRSEALQVAEECLQRAEAYPLPYIPAMVRAELIRFWIRVGDQERINDWLQAQPLSTDGPTCRMNEVEYIAFVKALLWQGRVDEALKNLDKIESLAQLQGRTGKLFYLLALRALAHQQMNDLDQALSALETSLKLAQHEAYIRAYVEEGQPMESLLQLGESRGVWNRAHLDGYVSQLLQAIHEDLALSDDPE